MSLGFRSTNRNPGPSLEMRLHSTTFLLARATSSDQHGLEVSAGKPSSLDTFERSKRAYSLMSSERCHLHPTPLNLKMDNIHRGLSYSKPRVGLNRKRMLRLGRSKSDSVPGSSGECMTVLTYPSTGPRVSDEAKEIKRTFKRGFTTPPHRYT